LTPVDFGNDQLAIAGLRWMITSASFRDRAVDYDADGYLQPGAEVSTP